MAIEARNGEVMIPLVEAEFRSGLRGGRVPTWTAGDHGRGKYLGYLRAAMTPQGWLNELGLVLVHEDGRRHRVPMANVVAYIVDELALEATVAELRAALGARAPRS